MISSKNTTSLVLGGGKDPAQTRKVQTDLNICPTCKNLNFIPATYPRQVLSFLLHMWRWTMSMPIFSNILVIVFLGKYTFSFGYLVWVFLQFFFNKPLRKKIWEFINQIRNKSVLITKNFYKSVYGYSIDDVVEFLQINRNETLTISKAADFFQARGYQSSEYKIRQVFTKLDNLRITQKDPRNNNARILITNQDKAREWLENRIDLDDGTAMKVIRHEKPNLEDDNLPSDEKVVFKKYRIGQVSSQTDRNPISNSHIS